MPFLTINKSYYSIVLHNKYFINLNIMSSCIKRVGQLCKEAGVDILVAGSYIFNSDDYSKAIESLK